MGLEVHSRLGRRQALSGFSSHIVADVFLYDVHVLEAWSIKPDVMIDEMTRVIDKHGGNIMGHQYHIFEPSGTGSFTILFMLKESHVAIHTWPDDYFMAIDVYTCGSEVDPIKMIHELVSLVDAADTEMLILKRGPNSS